MKNIIWIFVCILAYINLTSAKFTYGSFDLDFGRALLKRKWKKCTTEKRTSYSGKPIDTIRGVKNSHSCCVECKQNPSCDRWTYLPGKWAKCTLFNKRDRSVEKIKSRYHISGYASWRLQTKNWPKVKKVSQPSKDKNNNNNQKEEEVYNPPGFTGEEVYNPPGFSPGSDGEDVYNPPGFGSDGEVVYNPPGWYGGDSYGCDPDIDGLECLITDPPAYQPIKDFTRLNGKTLYGRRLNSIMNCVGNRASTADRCEAMCDMEGNCTGWTWTELDCSWVGESDLTGVCYLMSETDEGDIYDAPEGRFVSGLVQ